MRRLVLTIAAAALASGCSSGQGDVTCAELEGDAEAGRRMTAALVSVTQEDPELAEAMWATYCANTRERHKHQARPYREIARLLWERP